MDFDDASLFLETHHQGVIATRRPNGATHSSIVVVGAYEGNAAFVSVYPRSQKIRNLRRDPNCHSPRSDRPLARVGLRRGSGNPVRLQQHGCRGDEGHAARGVHGVQPHRASRLGRVRPGHDRPGGRNRVGQAGPRLRPLAVDFRIHHVGNPDWHSLRTCSSGIVDSKGNWRRRT